MNQTIQPQAEVHSYSLDIFDEKGQHLRTETFTVETRLVMIRHADGRTEIHHVS